MKKRIIKYIKILIVLLIVSVIVLLNKDTDEINLNPENLRSSILKAINVGECLIVINEPVSCMVTQDEEFILKSTKEQLNNLTDNIEIKKEWFISYKNLLKRCERPPIIP